MAPKDQGDAIYTFLSDLRFARETKNRLIQLAKTHPDQIVAFEDTARFLDEETRQLYLELKGIAEAEIRRQKTST